MKFVLHNASPFIFHELQVIQAAFDFAIIFFNAKPKRKLHSKIALKVFLWLDISHCC